MKLVTRLQKNKFLMIFLSLLICLTLIFSVISKPVKAAALIDDAIYFVLTTVLSSMMINIAVDNPDTGAELKELYDSLSSHAKDAVDSAASFVVTGSFSSYTWNTIIYKSLCNEIASWFVNNHVNTTEYGVVTATNPDGYIGFTNDSSFRIYFPDGVNSITCILPSSVLFINRYASSLEVPYYCFNLNYNVGYIVLKSNNGLAYITYGNANYNGDIRGKYFSSSITPNGNHEIYCPGAYFPAYLPFSTVYRDMDGCYYYDYENGVPYEIATDNGYTVLKSPVNGTIYKNMRFSSSLALADWFSNSCGFVTNSLGTDDVDIYIAPRPAVDYDPDRTSAALDVINSKDTDTLTTYLPGTVEQAQDISDNPAKVWDLDAVGVYTGSVQLPDLDSLAWYDKFPFCIPFDVVKLFTSFQATAEAPHWHFQVIPANFMGLSNEAIYFDIDFANYNVLVQILRFFLSVIFVFWLINVTRKLIGAE